jgi:hypothetical protein
VLLVVVPWTSYWERNFFVELESLRAVLLDPFLRGAVSGIGVLTALAGVAELLDLLWRRTASSESANTSSSESANTAS